VTRCDYLVAENGERLAYRHLDGASPGVLFCPGLYSDMQGSKALALEAFCLQQGRQFTRFDYMGHGQSDGDIRAGTIGRWSRDTLAVLDAVTRGPQVLVGSSMGGWMMLLAAQARPQRVAGLLGIAAAPDFTERMLHEEFSPAQRAQLAQQGYIERPSEYADSPYYISGHFLDEARDHLLLNRSLPIIVPVHLIHGQADVDVPWSTSLRLAECLQSSHVEISLIKSGDHRLSGSADLDRLCRSLEALLRACSGENREEGGDA
jgi:pimeloyl-ACP methyl ester carboxylesterase